LVRFKIFFLLALEATELTDLGIVINVYELIAADSTTL
jgi:hypothetical protein